MSRPLATFGAGGHADVMHIAAVTVSVLGLGGLFGVFLAEPGSKSDTCDCAHSDSAPATEVTKKNPLALLTNRIWQNKTPKNDRDLAFHLGLFEKAKVRTGLTGHISAWRYHFDSVRFRTKGDTLVIESPQDRTVTHFKSRIWSCKGEAPKPFDLCLELSKGNRKVRLYSNQSGFASQHAARHMQAPVMPHHQGNRPLTNALPQWFEDLAD